MDGERPAAAATQVAEIHPPGVSWGGFRLASHFQPIYSLPHSRLVGHEALLRAQRPDGSRLAPQEVFAACRDETSLSDCDRLCRLTQLAAYARQRDPAAARPDPEWLFLNVHPLAFQRFDEPGGERELAMLLTSHALPRHAIVLEILEAETADPARLTASISVARAAGMLIAIDDFGAGHSNFDRVWRMRPDIVKIDRSLVALAATQRSARRILAQMVSLLHECGCLVVIEGVETADEALVAIDCDAEMVQGYLFGRPQPGLLPQRNAPDVLIRLPGAVAALRAEHHRQASSHLHPFRSAMIAMASRLAMNSTTQPATHDSRSPVDEGSNPLPARFEAICREFLDLPDAEACFLLDADGRQISAMVQNPAEPDALDRLEQPMSTSEGGCWAQRPYFQQAVASPGKPHVSRPYRTVNTSYLVATVSMAFTALVDGVPRLLVACGDFRWQE